MIGLLTGEGLRWRHHPARLKAYQRITWLWAAMFALRLLVQLPLYFTDQVGALGVARLVMGVPFFALTVWLSWVILKAAPPPLPHEDDGPAEDPVVSDVPGGDSDATYTSDDVSPGRGTAAT